MTLELSEVTEVEIWRIFDIFVLEDNHATTFITNSDVIACVIEAYLCQSILFRCAWKVSIAKSTHVAPLNAFGVIAILRLWAIRTLVGFNFNIRTSTYRFIKIADWHLTNFSICGHLLWIWGFLVINVTWVILLFLIFPGFRRCWPLTLSESRSILTVFLRVIPVLWRVTIH